MDVVVFLDHGFKMGYIVIWRSFEVGLVNLGWEDQVMSTRVWL